MTDHIRCSTVEIAELVLSALARYLDGVWVADPPAPNGTVTIRRVT